MDLDSPGKSIPLSVADKKHGLISTSSENCTAVEPDEKKSSTQNTMTIIDESILKSVAADTFKFIS